MIRDGLIRVTAWLGDPLVTEGQALMWRVMCQTTNAVTGALEPCTSGLLVDGVKDFGSDETAARVEYPLHAGHGQRSIHYCNDDNPNPTQRWNDKDDPRAHYEESV